MKGKKIRYQPKSVLVLLIILVFVGLFVFKYIKTNGEQKIESVKFDMNCNLQIKNNKNDIKELKFSDGVISKKCDLQPVISNDKKYVGFEISFVNSDKNNKNGSANNTTFLYSIDKNNWIFYSHGASNAKNLQFDNDGLVSSYSYENQEIKNTIKFSDFDSELKNYESTAIQIITNLPEVKQWMMMVKNSDKSRPAIVVDHKDNEKIVIHVYESFEDGHTATFNWYEFNVLTDQMSKVFIF